mmetsp:Transcript_114850/g.319884  ORF Transcript_114850/g.319884 Transcript_114850/m.319884 type:complete len:227 (-) Transcript_114850:1976-2656(-)
MRAHLSGTGPSASQLHQGRRHGSGKDNAKSGTGDSPLLTSHRHPHEALPAPAHEEVYPERAARRGFCAPHVLLEAPVLLVGPQDRCVFFGTLVHPWVEDLMLIAILEEAELKQTVLGHLQGDGPHAGDRALAHALALPVAEGPRDCVVVVIFVVLDSAVGRFDELDGRFYGLVAPERDRILVTHLDVLVRPVPLPERGVAAVHAHLRRSLPLQPLLQQRLDVSDGG